jgi:iron complex outermembrane recepter protein
MMTSVSFSRDLQSPRAARRVLLSSAACLSLGAFSTAAIAQTAPAVDEENIIIVNARNQSETLQEVPVAVTVLSGDSIKDFQVNEIADVVTRVPALNVQVGGSGAGGQITLRGIGSTNISAAFDSAVAFQLRRRVAQHPAACAGRFL